MSEKPKRIKLQIQVSESIEERISKKADEYGMSKSAFCAFVLGNYLDQMDNMDSVFKGVSEQLMKHTKTENLSKLDN